MYYSTHYSSPLGPLTLASDGEHLAGLWLEGQKYFGDTVSGDMEERDGLPVFAAARDWLDRYFAGGRPPVAELPLAPVGGEFRQAVWKILCDIPYGEVTTYGEIARKMAARGNRRSMSAQAVGGAVGHNPISIIIPCHRVVEWTCPAFLCRKRAPPFKGGRECPAQAERCRQTVRRGNQTPFRCLAISIKQKPQALINSNLRYEKSGRPGRNRTYIVGTGNRCPIH